jgi:hypothetical protein
MLIYTSFNTPIIKIEIYYYWFYKRLYVEKYERRKLYFTWRFYNGINFYKDFALKHKLLLTCGSDFHGKTKPSIAVGSSNCENDEEGIISSLKKELNL